MRVIDFPSKKKNYKINLGGHIFATTPSNPVFSWLYNTHITCTTYVIPSLAHVSLNSNTKHIIKENDMPKSHGNPCLEFLRQSHASVQGSYVDPKLSHNIQSCDMHTDNLNIPSQIGCVVTTHVQLA